MSVLADTAALPRRQATSRAEATRRQLPATLPDVNAWVEANAGTGKTKVLTDRIVRLLLDDVRPERILCLTFTKAAAAEMRNRLSALLGRWAFADSQTLAAELEQVLDRRPSVGATLAARRLFARVLDAPGGIAIQTIHAFCQSLLKRFPLEAGVAPNAEVLDDSGAGLLLQRAMEAQLRDLADARAPAPLVAALATVSERISDREYIELVGALLNERARLHRLRSGDDADAKVEAALRQMLAVDDRRSVEQVLAASCSDDSFDVAGMTRAAAALARGSARDIERSYSIGSWLSVDRDRRIELFDTYCSAFFTRQGDIVQTLATKKAAAGFADIADVMRREAERLQAARDLMRGLGLIDATTALLRLAGDILERYEHLKRDAAVLDYDDLILRCRSLLQDPQAAAWVLYKLDGGIEHVLIDEAQDTNPDQWEVARCLTGEFFVGQGSVERPRTVFAVGDAKQSIFGFQRADPRKLAAMREGFRHSSEAAGREFRSVDLIDSFRSTEAVLSAVDRVFAGAEARKGVVGDGERIEHLAIRAGEAGCVELWPIVTDSDERAAADGSADPPTAAAPAQLRLARAIVAHCQSLIGRVANSRSGKPLTAGDIMILVRRRNELVPALVRELKRAGIPVAGVDRLQLMQQLAVRDLLALGHFVLLPQDDLNLACLLKSPLIGLDEDALFALAQPRSGDLWSALRERHDEPRFAEAHRRLSGWLARADFQPPFEFYARVLGSDGGRRQLLGRLGRDAQDPIDEFLATTLAYQAHEPPSLQGFLHWFEHEAQEIKRDLDQNRRAEVRILTVHAAKGLQAPVVYLPDTVRVPDAGSERVLWPEQDLPPLWIPRSTDCSVRASAWREAMKQRQIEEYHRLLYVAMTRAADRLYVCGATGMRKPDPGCWYELIGEGLKPASGPPGEAPMAPPIESFEFDSRGWIGDEQGWQGPGLRLAFGTSPMESTAPARGDGGHEALPDWARRPAEPEPSPPRPLAPSRLDLWPSGTAAQPAEPAMASPLQAVESDRFLRGNLMHRLLQSLPEIEPARRPEVAERYLALPGHGLQPPQVERWAQEVLAVLDAPLARQLFAPGSRAEVPIAGIVQSNRGRFVVSGQIDRLAIGSDEILIADFKTHRPPPQRVEDVAALYVRQLALYRAVLAQLYPGRMVRCLLLWTDGPSVMELPQEILAKALD